MANTGTVIHLAPYFYIHVHDNNSNFTRVEIGPQTYTVPTHEKVVFGPEASVVIPPQHYCVIADPVVQPVDPKGPVKLRFGDQEIRFHQEPFPLYPGESIVGKVTRLAVVAKDTALKLTALRDFEDEVDVVNPKTQEVTKQKVKRIAGSEWLFEGPRTYIPRTEIQIVQVVQALTLNDLQAVRLKATQDTIDKLGNKRIAGEEWTLKLVGTYLPGIHEEVIGDIKSEILTPEIALHLRAEETFTDEFGRTHKAGDEWLVTSNETCTYLPAVHEKLVGKVKLTTLRSDEYTVVIDPVNANGIHQYGRRELRKGPASFFLHPGERLERGIQKAFLLGADEALLLSVADTIVEVSEGKKIERKPGEKWMIYGPRSYVPPVEVEVLERRQAIPLDDNEGIYVRDIKTGQVRAVMGQTYMLSSNEELWDKDLPPIVEELLAKGGGAGDSDAIRKVAYFEDYADPSLNHGVPRDKTRVVSFRCPGNAAVQVFDFKTKKSRVLFGPALISLGPYEEFTVLSLSAGKPKREGALKSLCLLLGPDFITDHITVETSDHARLSLILSYNSHFVIDKTNEEQVAALFSVKDFIGSACRAIASRVRGTVASTPFDLFHKNSAEIIQAAVFGRNPDGTLKSKLVFKENNLHITNIDVQAVETVDQATKESLLKSVQLAIEISTKSQEAEAKHEAMRLEQIAKGKLERQKIQDTSEVEKSRRFLLERRAESAAIESTGQATAEARARADAAEIEATSSVKLSKLQAEAASITAASSLEDKRAGHKQELEYQRNMADLELWLSSQKAEIETEKFKNVVSSISPSTLVAIARAGPEMKAKLLGSLGISSLVISDGNSPLNLFNTAEGLVSHS